MNTSVFGIDIYVPCEDQRCILSVHHKACSQQSFRETRPSLEMMKMMSSKKGELWNAVCVCVCVCSTISTFYSVGLNNGNIVVWLMKRHDIMQQGWVEINFRASLFVAVGRGDWSDSCSSLWCSVSIEERCRVTALLKARYLTATGNRATIPWLSISVAWSSPRLMYLLICSRTNLI